MIALQVYFLNAMISIGRHIMANKKYEDFIYRDFIGDTISQDEFEEIMLEVLEEEEKYSLEDYLHMLQMSGDELKEYINNIKKQYPKLFRYGKERICLCRELEKAKRDSDLYLICLLLCDDGILTEIDYITEKNLRSFAKYIFDVKNVEQEIEKRRTMHRKWKQLLQKLYEYDNSTSVHDSAVIDHNAIFNVYRDIYPLNKIGPYLMQNLETLAVTVSAPPLNEIAPLYVYQMLTKHISRLNKNEGLQVNQESLWKYQQYQIDFDNGKNFKANAKSIELFLDLCKLFADSPAVDILLCQYGFIQLSNLYRFYEENCLKDGEFLIEPLESWMLEHPFSCYPNGDEDAFVYRRSGISYLKYRRFRRSPAKKESLEYIFCTMVEREDEFVQRFLDADEAGTAALCEEILGEIPLNFTLKTIKQDLPIYLAVVNVYLQDFVNLAALECLKRAVEGIFDLE